MYELPPLGQGLETAVLELGKWGSQFLPTSLKRVALPSLGAMALAIKAFFHPEQAREINETYELHLGNEILQARVAEGALRIQRGRSLKADVVFHTEMRVFVGLFAGQIKPDEAISRGLIQIQRARVEDEWIEDDRIEDDRIEDDLSALRRFLKVSGVPGTMDCLAREQLSESPN